MKSAADRDPVTGLRPQMREFIDWLVDPDRVGSQNQWALEHDLSGSTVAKWRNQDPHFQAALNARMAKDHLDPAGMVKSIEALKKKADQGDVQAFKALLDYFKWLDPKPSSGAADTPVELMSDAELAALGAELVASGLAPDADAE